MQLQSHRLLIRPIQNSDTADVFEYRSDAETNKYQGWIPKSEVEVSQFISKNPISFNLPDTWFQLVIIEKESKKLVGDIGVHFMDTENLQVELGCTIHKLFQKNGFAKEALNEVIRFLFEDLNKHRITTSIDPKNTASIKLVESLGFRKEAHFIESLFLNGKWVDDMVYALLKKDFEKLTGSIL